MEIFSVGGDEVVVVVVAEQMDLMGRMLGMEMIVSIKSFNISCQM